jgi:hypothetical protein
VPGVAREAPAGAVQGVAPAREPTAGVTDEYTAGEWLLNLAAAREPTAGVAADSKSSTGTGGEEQTAGVGKRDAPTSGEAHLMLLVDAAGG